MKARLLISLGFCLLSACLGSCSSYTTYIPNDPLFQQETLAQDSLISTTNSYTQRGDYFVDQTLYQPAPEEKYDDYRARIINTLLVQEHQVNSLKKSIRDKKESIAYLNKQLNNLRAQHVDLRLKLAKQKGEMGDSQEEDSLFAKHVIAKGDTLQKIAFQTYGLYNAWLGIYRFNTDQLTFGPDRLEAGTEILIPRAKNLFFRRR